MKIKCLSFTSLLLLTLGLQAGDLTLYVKNNSRLVDGNNQPLVWAFFEPGCGLLEKCNWNNAKITDKIQVNLQLTEWNDSIKTCCSDSFAIGKNITLAMKGKTARKGGKSQVMIIGRYQVAPNDIRTISLRSWLAYGDPNATDKRGQSERYPIIFPGYWAAEGSAEYNNPQNYTSLPIPPVRKFYEKNYKFIPFFTDWSYKNNENQRRNIPFEDLALPPAQPAGYKTQAQLNQEAVAQQANIPALFLKSDDGKLAKNTAGSFGKITNQTAMSYQIKDSGLPPLAGNGITTNVPTQWPATKQTLLGLIDSSQTITFVPTDATLGFPSFTFTFDDSAQTIKISRSGDDITAITWTIDFAPIMNFARAIQVPGPQSWSIDFTINKDAKIVINNLKVNFDTYKADVTRQTIVKTQLSYTFLANATYKSVNGKQVGTTSGQIEGIISGGLCGTTNNIVLPKEPSCSTSGANQ